VAEPELSFAGLLRQLRAEARLTQEELAQAASLSLQAVSTLERGIHRTAHKDTASCWPMRWACQSRHASCSSPRSAARPPPQTCGRPGRG
jgi:DNA-binding XRE family transcriptional regulator